MKNAYPLGSEISVRFHFPKTSWASFEEVLGNLPGKYRIGRLGSSGAANSSKRRDRMQLGMQKKKSKIKIKLMNKGGSLSFVPL